MDRLVGLVRSGERVDTGHLEEYSVERATVLPGRGKTRLGGELWDTPVPDRAQAGSGD